jgi:hypothetical protein
MKELTKSCWYYVGMGWSRRTSLTLLWRNVYDLEKQKREEHYRLLKHCGTI